MAITSGNNASATAIARQNSNAIKAEDNREIKNVAAQAKQAQNVAILKANEQVSLRSNNDSLSLLYKTALDAINAELEPVMGENAAQKIYDSGIDTSPEATADRILAFATGFYSRYKELTPDKTEAENLTAFLDLITPGIEKGFADAKDILKSLKVYEGEVETGVDSTYSLVMQGLDSFREKMFELAKAAETDSDTSADNGTEPDVSASN
ncbi:DUF5610 domain-containing protein [Rheinheimera pleomorphica]|uniref:DUF5610 domain-containing protein n=1 Tax=Rheinheimera pleomorphica TaxID=2703963 RepID=UPI00141E281E|nr:DUF5610 domain-containing protein [Rheinheimera pleomorphica]